TTRARLQLSKRNILASGVAAILLSACRSKKGDLSRVADLQPEVPIDKSFQSYQKSASCGSRSAPKDVDLMLQPGAKPGDYTRCPVSGAVFRVTDERPRREYRGHPVFLCCNTCAGYFDEHADAVATLRRL